MLDIKKVSVNEVMTKGLENQRAKINTVSQSQQSEIIELTDHREKTCCRHSTYENCLLAQMVLFFLLILLKKIIRRFLAQAEFSMTAKPKITISLEIFDRRRFNNSLKHVNLGKYIGIAGKRQTNSTHGARHVLSPLNRQCCPN